MSIITIVASWFIVALLGTFFFLIHGLQRSSEKNVSLIIPEKQSTSESPGKTRKKTIAIIKCAGAKGLVKQSFVYGGYPSCRIAFRFFGGGPACQEACIGFGDCATVCKYQAIKIEHGIAIIKADRCVGCGDCVAVCPKKLIELVNEPDACFVACSSQNPENVKKDICKAACTACRICEHHSIHGEFFVKNNLAFANYDRSDGAWESIAARCPASVIKAVKKKNEQPYIEKR